MRILNKSHVFFTCTCAMAPVPVPLTIIETNIKVFENTGIDNNILTDKCRLMGTFVSCRNVPTPAGSPGGPCTMALTVWNNTSGKINVCGSNVLTDKSSIGCSLGGTIKPFLTTVTKSNIDKGISLKSEIPSVTIAGTEIIKPVKNENTVSIKNESPDIIKEDITDIPSDNTDINIENTDKVNSSVSDNDTINSKNETEIDYAYTLCDYKNCPEKDNCEYLKTSYNASSIDNNSTKLENNFKTKYPVEYQNFIDLQIQKNNESTEGNWKKAAHHIISGDQVFSKHPYLVKLANYYKYDVNNAENCIMLPSTNDFEGKKGVDKQANGYVAMDLMKMQWHVGGHAYSLDSDTVAQIINYLKYTHKNSRLYKDYAEALEHEVNNIETKYKKLSCRKKDYQVKRERFINAMNKVSHNIGAMIASFENNYKKSYPFYVSKEACMFAYNVPNNKKIILLYSKEKYKKVYYFAVKTKVTRYEKDNYKVIFVCDDDYMIEDDLAFVKYCGNVKYFINLTGKEMLPWQINNSREYVLNDIMTQEYISDYCKDNEQKILSFIEARSDGELYYESDTKIIRQRLNDISKG